jgi:dipeptidyl aminopeptidase/acylaminoacyl peptidase
VEAPYGSWKSPIAARLIAEGGIGLGWPQAVGEAAYWVEMRPTEGGRYVVVRRDPDGTVADVTPPGINARTLVHEYGGGMYVAFRNALGGESVIFSDFVDQRLYRQDLGASASPADAGAARWGAPRPITPAPPAPQAWRYADGRVTPDGERLVCVRERHGEDDVVNDLVALPTEADSGSIEGAWDPVVVASGHDFFAAPRLSADGHRLAFLCWDHPRMPWDGTELRVLDLGAGAPSAAGRGVAGTVPPQGESSVVVAGGVDESVAQPQWAPNGDLLYVGDRSGWWNPYRVDAAAIEAATAPGQCETTAPGQPEAVPLAPMDAEFAKPHWVFGHGTCGLLPDGGLAAVFTRNGVDQLGVVREGRVDEIATEFTEYAALTTLGSRILVVAASPVRSWSVALVDPRGGRVEVLRRSRANDGDARFLSRPEPIAFPTWYEPGSVTGPLAEELARVADEPARGDDEAAAGHAASPAPGKTLLAHALYFPPTNPDFTAPAGEKPPLLVISHGGPTSAHATGLTMDIQYWTSRGFAVVDVNYGGSTGYGRAYRERLKGNWGIVDTVDCIRAAEYLVARGDVDPQRLAIRGGSAGGYTTLNALTRFDTFAAGASHFGLADLERFVAGGTHKFEERYTLPLIGPYPEAAAVYRKRSPINHVDGIACPVILFQGLDDHIVPPEQAEMIVAALDRKGLPYAYLPFEGEQHGFRKAENIVRCFEAELYFYGKVFGFEPADEIAPVAIENLPS